jgi:inorganic pyrophosphatase
MADKPQTSFDAWRPHPWHGLSAGVEPPSRVQAFIEITPFDTIKYEIDKESGYLRVDRPQRTSSLPPTLYGFIPRTYCGDRVASLTDGASTGDGDPLDICVLSERAIARAEILVRCVVVGGLTTVDRGAADDKIIAVLEGDALWGEAHDIGGVPNALVNRLRHYFATYKAEPGSPIRVDVRDTYGAARAHDVIRAALADYEARFASGDGGGRKRR